MLIKWCQQASEYISYICGGLLLASVLLISAETVLRKFFLVSFGGADELSGYVLGILITWSLAFVLFEKMHIRIDVVYTKLSSSIQRWLDVLAMGFTLGFVLLLCYFSYDVVSTSIIKSSTANTPLGTPLWLPQTLWWLGLIFFAVVVVLLLVVAIKSAIGGQSNDYTRVK